jgi:hypothetical protein
VCDLDVCNVVSKHTQFFCLLLIFRRPLEYYFIGLPGYSSIDGNDGAMYFVWMCVVFRRLVYSVLAICYTII